MAFVDGTGTIAAVSTVTGSGNINPGSLVGVAAAVADLLGVLTASPRVLSVAPVTSTRLRVTFTKGMTNNAALRSVLSYTPIAITPGAANIFVSAVTPENATNPTFVDLAVSEMTNGATYQVDVATTLVDVDAIFLDVAVASDTFVGLGTPPTIDRVESIGANRADVIFDESMSNNSDIRNPAKYAFDNGLSVLSVLDVAGTTAKLVTSEQVPGVLYTLTVTP